MTKGSKRANKGQQKKALKLKRDGKQVRQRGTGKRQFGHTFPAQQGGPKPLISKSNLKKVKGGSGGGHGGGRGDSGDGAQSAGQQRASVIGSHLYSPSQRILLLGEGDFSFAAALCVTWGSQATGAFLATAYDDEATCCAKYVAARDNVDMIREMGGSVVFGVDATRLLASAAVRKAAKRGFDRVGEGHAE